MKKSDLRRVLKPIVKECVKEALLEEGVLSGIISEVVKGVTTSPLVESNKHRHSNTLNDVSKQQKMIEQQRQELHEEKRRRLKEQKIKLLNATGFGNEIFEGVEPLSTGGTPNATTPHSPLSGVDAKDPGVDISGIMAIGGDKWKKLV